MHRFIAGIFLLFAMYAATFAQCPATPPASLANGRHAMQNISHLNDFQVIELRRYQIKDGARANFAAYFESFFPEAFQQLGALALGQFFERKNPNAFTWLRGFKDMDARAIVNSAFYYGPVWKEHRTTLNDLIVDSDNVMLLRPLHQNSGVSTLPAVDPVCETQGAQGVVVAQIFALKADDVKLFARQAASIFAAYQAAGVRQAGLLVTLDAKNNFPQLPVRTDGLYLVWLGIAKDDQQLESKFYPLADRAARELAADGLLRSAPELVILDPAKRSRLRWLAE
ncbi:NIPSNAP protein [Collimonas sp. OK242]|nr:NIPSNAP protein [Collimonas sp. OK242]